MPVFQLQMDSSGGSQQMLNQFDPFVPAEISRPRMVGHKSRVEYVWQIFPYLITAFVIFAGFFVSAKLGTKYWRQRDDVKIFGLPWGRRAGHTFGAPRTFFKTLRHISDAHQHPEVASEGNEGGIRAIYRKLKSICRRWISRRSESDDSYTIVNLLGIVELRRKNPTQKAEPKDGKLAPKRKLSCAPFTNMASVLRRWDDILRLLFAV